MRNKLYAARHALETACAIILNEAGIKEINGNKVGAATLRRWTKELKKEGKYNSSHRIKPYRA